MKKPKVLQLNNPFIQTELQKKRAKQEENRQKNRFMGLILILVVFLFVLPTYNLAESYYALKQKEQQLTELQNHYEDLKDEKRVAENLVNKLKNDEYAAKYIRAKYKYSKEGEFVYNIPGLLPE